MLDLSNVPRPIRIELAAGRMGKHSMGSERRKHPRFSSNFPVTFTGETASGDGTVMNLSREGCMVESDIKVEQGAYLAMSIHFPQQLMPVEVELAAVRWVSGRVFGVEFRYMQPEHHESLEKFLSTHQTQPPS